MKRSLSGLLALLAAFFIGGAAWANPAVPTGWPGTAFTIITTTDSYGNDTIYYDPTNGSSAGGCATADMTAGTCTPVKDNNYGGTAFLTTYCSSAGSSHCGATNSGIGTGEQGLFTCFAKTGTTRCIGGNVQSAFTPGSFTCPGGTNNIGGNCATCPAGQIVENGACVNACSAATGSEITTVFNGNWMAFLESQTGSGHFKYPVNANGSSGNYCEVVFVEGNYMANGDATAIFWKYSGSSGGTAEVDITTYYSTSTGALTGTGTGQLSLSQVDVVNAPGQTAQTPSYTTVVGNVTTTPSGTQTISGTVGISGTPNVAVTSMPAVNIAPGQTVGLAPGTNSIGSVSINGTPTVSLGNLGTTANPLVTTSSTGGGGGGGLGTQSAPSIVAPQTGTGNGTGGTTCCAAGSVVGLPAWPTTVNALYTPMYSSWSDVYSAAQTALQGGAGSGLLWSLASLSLTASANYNGGYPTMTFTLPTRLMGGATYSVGLAAAEWDDIRLMVLMLTGYVCIWLVFRG